MEAKAQDYELIWNFSQEGLLDRIDLYRTEASRRLDDRRRSQMGQFFTPPAVARLMTSLFGAPPQEIRLLDAGAGVGSLTAAFVQDLGQRDIRPASVSVLAYEIEPLLNHYLASTMAECQTFCHAHQISFIGEIKVQDFIRAGTEILMEGLFPVERHSFNRAILNPPYKKIDSNSTHRQLLHKIGIETSNLYSAFLALAADLLEPGGELVAITPRSFCNGPYFRAFRKRFLSVMSLRRIHVFESREQVFGGDEVLQENIIFHAIKNQQHERVIISQSYGPDQTNMTWHEVAYDQVIKPNDTDAIIHIVTTQMDQFVLDRLQVFDRSLADLGLDVSTGRVVDFRAQAFLRNAPEQDTVPLIYPTHFEQGFVCWPKAGGKKPNALVLNQQTQPLVLPPGTYVLVRRFSAKEERRRVVAAIYDPARVSNAAVGFENHLNVYHGKNAGLPAELARGLAVFLNSTLVDSYFRQFNGHTQVNATDLRMLRYPSRDVLVKLGALVDDMFPSQAQIDALLEKEVQRVAEINSPDPVAVKLKMDEALEILGELGLPRGQQNERSALTLLALLNLKPALSWQDAEAPLIGITPILEFCLNHYGRRYAPNTRETFRRQTMHQFVEAGLVVPNPDDPARPVNSPRFCYQIEPAALELLKTYGTAAWEKNLEHYLAAVETLKQRYARIRQMRMIPLVLAEGEEIYLSSGEHSKLIRAIVDEFASRFAPGGRIIYVGDTGAKMLYFDADALGKLGVTIDVHGKMPDVVIYHVEKDWLLLVEAVTSHGPVDAKRRAELAKLFEGARPGLVYITAFLTRRDMAKYIGDISWETEVWVKESGTHIIHFNGERFLGPYDV